MLARLFFVDENCKKTDILPDDQAMFFDTPRGLVVLLGCSHAGIVNTSDYAVKLTGKERIYSIIGGLHLLNSSQERIERTISVFQKYDVQRIGLAHCTGANATRQISNAFPDRCSICYTGSQVNLLKIIRTLTYK